MAVNLSPVGGVAGQFFDNNGNPLTGGKLYTYAAGTTTPQTTYTSAAGVIAHSNPIILNAGGRVPNEIWLTDGLQYKFALYDANNVLIGTWDDIIGINSNFVNFVTAEEVQIATAGQTVFTLTTMQYQPGTNNLVVYVDGVNQVEGGSYSFVETNSTTVTFTAGLHVGALVKFVSAEVLSTNVTSASTTTFTGFNSQVGVVQDIADADGSDWIGFEPDGTGAVARSVESKLRETVSVKDFGAVGDGVTDDTAAFNAATAFGGRIFIPEGVYILNGALLRSGIELFGEGVSKTILRAKPGANNAVLITENFAILQNALETIGGANYKTRAGSSDFSIHDLRVEGNYVPTFSTGGVVTSVTTNATVDGIKIYGCNFRLYNMEIVQCRYNGLYAEWSEAGSRANGYGELEASLTDIKIFYCGRCGIDWRGPHDSVHDRVNVGWNNLNNFLYGTEGEFPGWNIQTVNTPGATPGSTAAGQTLINCHIWGGSHSIGLDALAVTWVRDGYYEQARSVNIRIRALGCIVGGAFVSAAALIKTGMVGVQIGLDADSGVPSYNNVIRCYFAGLPTAVYLQASGGQNLIRIEGYPDNASSNAYTGTPAATDRIEVLYGQNACIVASHHTVETKRQIIAWALINGATGAIIEAEGIASVTKFSTGWFNINFGRDINTTKYAVTITPGFDSDITQPGLFASVHRRYNTGVTFATYTSSGVVADASEIHVVIIGDGTQFR